MTDVDVDAADTGAAEARRRRRGIAVWTVVLVVGVLLGAYVIGRAWLAPRFETEHAVESGGVEYAGTPYTFTYAERLTDMPIQAHVTSATVESLPAGLHARVYAVRRGAATGNIQGWPGDPATHHGADLVPVDGYRLWTGRAHGPTFFVVVTADRLGTFHVGGLRIHWRAGPFSGSHLDPYAVTLHVTRTGADPSLTKCNPLAQPDYTPPCPRHHGGGKPGGVGGLLGQLGSTRG